MVAGPLNNDGHTLTLKKASETTPAEILCQITCHDADSERQYNPRLRIGIMYETQHAIEQDLTINTNHSEPGVYYIHSEYTSYCHSDNNEINFVSYVYMYPQSPILLAFCGVTYLDTIRSTHEICHGSSIAVIIYEESSSTTTTDANSNSIESTRRLDGVSSTSEHGEEFTSNSINVDRLTNPLTLPPVVITSLVIMGLALVVETTILAVITILWIKSKKSTAKVDVIEVKEKTG